MRQGYGDQAVGPPLTILFPASISPWPSLAVYLCTSCVCAFLSFPLIFSFSLAPSPPVPLALAPHPRQQSLKADSRPLEGSLTQLPILADMLLYYCRFAARPVLLQVYQTEVRPALPLHATFSIRLTGRPSSALPGSSLCPAGPVWPALTP